MGKFATTIEKRLPVGNSGWNSKRWIWNFITICDYILESYPKFGEAFKKKHLFYMMSGIFVSVEQAAFEKKHFFCKAHDLELQLVVWSIWFARLTIWWRIDTFVALGAAFGQKKFRIAEDWNSIEIHDHLHLKYLLCKELHLATDWGGAAIGPKASTEP